MAKTLIPKFITILSLFIFLLSSLHFKSASSFEDEEYNDVANDNTVVYGKLSNMTSTRSRFLATSMKKLVKKNPVCNAKSKPYVCNGLWTNKGKSLLYCCKKHCRDVLGDCNNCGKCGRKCKFGEKCCGGVCTNVLRNKNNCGKCNKKCRRGVKCEYGYCGYA
ncbi:hypothetical protein ACJIZ3_010511 [Penstemon smallii]|uniref:Uncharacterized protein n=1 Tax=Penstemon smallii TaxID=265156 RepID=A0ABD3UGI1_9LAMI